MKYILAIIIGSILGSFLLCLCTSDHIFKRSKCDHCMHQLNILDLLPIVSYIFLKGRCRYCNNRIDKSYLLSELTMSFICVLLVYRYDLSLYSLKLLIISCVMFCISIIDIKTYIIPFILNVLIVLYRLIFDVFNMDDVLIGLIVSFSIFILSYLFRFILHKETMGLGDIKLLFSLGLYLGFIENIMAVFLSCLFGLIYGLYKRKDDYFAFGPFICMGYLMMFIFGKQILDFYYNLI